MASWTQTRPSSEAYGSPVHSKHSPTRVFTRKLGLNELGFYYDGKINGTADSVSHSTLRAAPGIVTLTNVTRVWTMLKHRYPLLGASVYHVDSEPQLRVDEDRLASLSVGELTWATVPTKETANALAASIVHEERKLSDALLARVEVWTQNDEPSISHLMIHLAHLITDGVSGTNLLRTFLTFLSSPEDNLNGPIPAIETRLALAVSAESLTPPARSFSLARQRWRKAAGKIISKMQDSKRQGGHTLPRAFGPIAARIPARSAMRRVQLSPAETSRLLQNCRHCRITVGNALPVLAQVALARVLCRKFLRGEIEAAEWEFRRQQPSHTAGPVNIRPYLDSNWYQAGGKENVSVYVGYFYLTASFTPLPRLSLGDRLPEMTELMSHGRFLLRCNRMKQLATKYLQHPLFFEIGAARLENKIPIQKEVAQKIISGQKFADPNTLNASPMEQVRHTGSVFSHAWSTFGNVLSFPSAQNSSPDYSIT
ncbi:hypothetical protein MIND_01024700 [Mycena indigotica]|uniref:Uncharacterized protein n=1 Tax=Mycena indigotica TaxID=2126181 RepID=A0A8H6S8N0_9AGAR|nr:uncharacterized protein MIND_01024700 [Mycena indigotica]KAF7294868.1 hypothetical protein MIND_01024700 [Mycena indigotica]